MKRERCNGRTGRRVLHMPFWRCKALNVSVRKVVDIEDYEEIKTNYKQQKLYVRCVLAAWNASARAIYPT
jgi:hypothetical protein